MWRRSRWSTEFFALFVHVLLDANSSQTRAEHQCRGDAGVCQSQQHNGRVADVVAAVVASVAAAAVERIRRVAVVHAAHIESQSK